MPIYFGERIKTARKAAGLTQKQLADKIKVTNTSISNWETNISRPDPDTIQHLCWALGVEPNYFFSNEGLKSAEVMVKDPDVLDEIDVAFYGEYKELNDEDKETVRSMVRIMRERRVKKQEN